MIAENRAQLAELLDQLGDELPVHRTVPEEVLAPCVIVQPAEDFISEAPDDTTYAGELLLSWELLILVELSETHDNQQASDQLDGLLGELLVLLDGSSWWLVSTGQPETLFTTSWAEHGVRATVRAMIERPKG